MSESDPRETSAKPSLLGALPNQLTTARLALSFALFAAIGTQAWLTALLLFAAAAVTDWLDGYLARGQGLVTSFGRAYDPLVDKVLVCGAFIFLLDEPSAGLAPWMVTVVVVREFLVTGLRGYLEEQGLSFGADQLGKLKMALQCAAVAWILALLHWFPGLDNSTYSPPLILRDVLNFAAVLATIASGANYVRRAWPYL